LISVNKIYQSFGDKVLFDYDSLFIAERDKIGLVGKNGAGKSTLLKMLAGISKPLEGSISTPTELTIGYLSQSLDIETKSTVREACRAVFGNIMQLEGRRTEIEGLLSDEANLSNPNYLDWLNELTHINDQLALSSGDKLEKKIELILGGLGFETTVFDNPISTLSGGWQMRVILARLLLSEPQLLLLDEPTNHLDIIAIEWLQEFLHDYPGAIVVISHDQHFLDHVTKRTVEISLGKFYDYKFHYSKYLEVRKEEIERQKQKIKDQEKYIKETKVLIEKFRAKKSKAAFAQSLIRKLERLEAIEVEDFNSSNFRFSFQEPERSGKVVLKTKNLAKSFGDKTIFKNLNIEIERKQKVALLGKNGTGKTTLIKLLVGQLEKSEGSFELGHNVTVGYYAQDQAEQLDENATVLETIEAEATGDLFKASRKILGSFMFSGEDVDKKVKVLSGGERARLALCKLLLKSYNFLILDEPTNHLDIASKNILKAALEKFEGTILVVSHDRTFLSSLTDQIIEIRPNGISEYIGDIDAFLDEKRKESIMAFERIEKAKVEAKTNSSNKSNFKLRKQFEKEHRKLNNLVKRLEEELENKMQLKDDLELKMADPSFYNSSAYEKTVAEHKDLENSINVVEEKWEEAMLELESLEDPDLN
jgi:ATP-binding cassette subfamily F protein 3